MSSDIEKPSIKNFLNLPSLITIVLILITGVWIFFHIAKVPPKEAPSVKESSADSVKPTETPLGASAVAWTVLQDYFTAVKARDLEAINSMVYRRLDPKNCGLDEDMCLSLIWSMTDSYVKEAQTFKKGEFANVSEDSNQVIMSTDLYAKVKTGGTSSTQAMPDSGGLSKTFAYFVIDSEGNVFLLSCATRSWYLNSGESAAITSDADGDGLTDADETCSGTKQADKNCVGTNPTLKDTDGDGWWDSIEEAAGTDPNNLQDYPFKPVSE